MKSDEVCHDVITAEKVTVLYSNATFTGTALFVAKDAGLCKQKGAGRMFLPFSICVISLKEKHFSGGYK